MKPAGLLQMLSLLWLLLSSLSFLETAVSAFSPVSSSRSSSLLLQGGRARRRDFFLKQHGDVLIASSTSGRSSSQLNMAKRKKPSMAEKRAKRSAKKVSSTTLTDTLPKCKLDFKTPPASKNMERNSGPSTAGTAAGASASSSATTTTTPGLDASKKITDPQVAEQRAQKLVQAQRESVEMLSRVRECIEALPTEIIHTSLETDGYFIWDDFLKDEMTLNQLEQEGISLLTKENQMEVDLAHLGSGEYITAIKGGTEQYTNCPRMVELVVSATKHLPPQLETKETEIDNNDTGKSKALQLDASNCMATLRTFDRNAFKASLELLTGGNEDETTVDSSELRSFGIIATEPKDQRKLSLFYYVVPANWNEDCGGGLSFGGDTSSSTVVVPAKRDRLIILKSDSCSVRQDVWKGNDMIEAGSCLELHLVQKKKIS